MINRQVESITGMYSSTPIHPLLCEAGLIPASILLDYRQRIYTCRLLRLPEIHPAKNILPISLRNGDQGFQLGELPENTLLWTENSRPTLYGQWLAWQLTIDHSIDPAEGVEPVENMMSDKLFKADVIIQCKKKALEEARKNQPGLVLWTDGSKLNQGQVGAAVGKISSPVGGKKGASFWERTRR